MSVENPNRSPMSRAAAWRGWLLLCLLVTSALLALPLLSSKAPASLNPPPIKESPEVETLKKTSKAFSAVAKKAVPAVVFIESQVVRKEANDNPWNMFNDEFFNRFFGMPQQHDMRQRPTETVRGSGFLVSSKGYILTNNHVVDRADQISVTMGSGKKMQATVIGVDPRSDLAVIKVEEGDYPFLQLGDSDELEVGDWVVAIGNPFGLEASVTVGVVSALGRNQLHLTEFENWIQTDAAINPGNSGGPLLDLDAQVVGINTAIMSASGGYMGIGFAIPSNMAKQIMDQLITNGSVTRAFLGVSLQPIDSALADSFQLEGTHGALITDVAKGSPAEKAGLQRGDIILKYNDTAVDGPGSFRNEVALMKPGTTILLTINRDGKTMVIDVTLGENPDNALASIGDLYDMVGLEVSDLTPELATRLGYVSDSGVVVTRIRPGSPAEQAGMRPGNLIVAVGSQQVATMGDFKKALADSQKQVRLLVRQGPLFRYVVLPLKK